VHAHDLAKVYFSLPLSHLPSLSPPPLSLAGLAPSLPPSRSPPLPLSFPPFRPFLSSSLPLAPLPLSLDLPVRLAGAQLSRRESVIKDLRTRAENQVRSPPTCPAPLALPLAPLALCLPTTRPIFAALIRARASAHTHPHTQAYSAHTHPHTQAYSAYCSSRALPISCLSLALSRSRRGTDAARPG